MRQFLVNKPMKRVGFCIATYVTRENFFTFSDRIAASHVCSSLNSLRLAPCNDVDGFVQTTFETI